MENSLLRLVSVSAMLVDTLTNLIFPFSKISNKKRKAKKRVR